MTAGIDDGLVIAAKLRGEEQAKRAQLTIEYSPQPPFLSGTPREADSALVTKIEAGRVGMDGGARIAAQAAAARFKV